MALTVPEFKDQDLLSKAFTHRSYLNESRDADESNERLEFLGDSILSFVVSSYIYRKYPELKEGELTNLRASLINTHTLYLISKDLDLGSHLKLSKGEEASGGRQNRSLLANTLEAVIGALFLDQGLEAVRIFITDILLSRIDELVQENSLKDPKSVLQELLQEKHKVSPSYQILHEEGPDHAKLYTVGVYLREQQLAQGKGTSKQEAEKQAAKAALETFK